MMTERPTRKVAKQPITTELEAADAARHEFMRRLGLLECEHCKSWIYPTRHAAHFHYRRCSG
jgi:hypothetical protein